MITIYSTKSCQYCKMAKAYFDSIGKEYVDRDVEGDEAAIKEMVEKSGQLGVPVIDIDGTIIVGFDRHHIEHVLGIADHEH